MRNVSIRVEVNSQCIFILLYTVNIMIHYRSEIKIQ